MMKEGDPEYIALAARVVDRQVCLELEDGSTHSFPCALYQRLAHASDEDLQQVQLRVGGRALRWENLDEDIWIADSILRRYPNWRTG